MVQIKIILLIFLALIVTVVYSTESQRQRKILSTRKFQPLRQRPAVQQKRVILARQEAVTPYPTADELKPEIPFEEESRPDEVYGPPDETYGPPKLDKIPADQLPSEEAPKEFTSNVDAETFNPAAEVDSLLKAPEQVLRLIKKRKTNILSHLVQKRKTRNTQRFKLAQFQVIAAPSSALPVTLPLSSPYKTQSQQYYISNQPSANTAYYQFW